MHQRGEIVLGRFPFTDGSGAKYRPLLVLAAAPGSFPDYLVMFITSQLSHAAPGVDVVLDPGDPRFAGTGLKVASAFRIGKIATISDALIAGTLGQLDAAAHTVVVDRLVDVLRPK
jgi:mRNA interferase MazF